MNELISVYVFCLELTSQLLAAENKCNLLEKQLEYMRNMIKHAEMERTSVLEKQVWCLTKSFSAVVMGEIRLT